MILPSTPNFERRPQEFAIEFATRLQKDMVAIILNVRDTVDSGRGYHTDHDIHRMTAELCIDFAKGLKDVLKYAEAYGVHHYRTIKPSKKSKK